MDSLASAIPMPLTMSFYSASNRFKVSNSNCNVFSGCDSTIFMGTRFPKL